MHEPLAKLIPGALDATEGRKAYLDGLRGCAACVVFFAHILIALNSQLNALFNGNAAVCVFFVLSGYVLTDLARRSGLSFPAQALVARKVVSVQAVIPWHGGRDPVRGLRERSFDLQLQSVDDAP